MGISLVVSFLVFMFVNQPCSRVPLQAFRWSDEFLFRSDLIRLIAINGRYRVFALLAADDSVIERPLAERRQINYIRIRPLAR